MRETTTSPARVARPATSPAHEAARARHTLHDDLAHTGACRDCHAELVIPTTGGPPLDPIEIDPATELAMLRAGRTTWDVLPLHGKRRRVWLRWPEELRAHGSERTNPVITEHRCGEPPPGPRLSAAAAPPLPADAPPPF